MVSEVVFFYLMLSVILMYYLYKYVTVHANYFFKQNLKFVKPRFLFGHTIWLILRQYTPANFIDSIYYSFPNEKYVLILSDKS